MRDESSIQFDEDIHLMAKAKGGDRHAYSRLYEKYVPIVRRYIAGCNGRREGQEDLVQEVFTRVWERRGRYRPGTPVCPYLLGFATNVIREYQTRMYREITIESRRLNRDATWVGADPEAAVCRNDMTERFTVCFAKLPPKQRQALELVYLAHTSIAEAAEIMSCSKEALRRSLYEARRRLHKTLLCDGKRPGPF